MYSNNVFNGIKSTGRSSQTIINDSGVSRVRCKKIYQYFGYCIEILCFKKGIKTALNCRAIPYCTILMGKINLQFLLARSLLDITYIWILWLLALILTNFGECLSCWWLTWISKYVELWSHLLIEERLTKFANS